MHRPGHVARRLAISPATLRVWSGEFARFLSNAAQKSPTETGTRAQRRYTDRDLETLQRIKALLAEGATYAEARDALAEAGEPVSATSAQSDTPAPSVSLATLEQYRLSLASMQQTVEAQAAHIADLQAERDRAQAEAAELRRAMLDQARRPEPERPTRPWWQFWKRDD